MASDTNYFRMGQFYTLLKNQHIYQSNLNVFLKKSGLDVNYAIPSGNLLTNHKPQYLGYTALHFAVEFKAEAVVKELLLAGAKITKKANNSFTPLRLAVEGAKYEANRTFINVIDEKSMINILLANKNKDDTKNPCCDNGISHFHISCLANNKMEVDHFLKAGVPVNWAVNSNSNLFPGFTPLHFAVRYGDEKLVQQLLEAGADMSIVDGNGMTPLHLVIDRCMEINDRTFLGMDLFGFKDTKYKYSVDAFIAKKSLVEVRVDKWMRKDDIEWETDRNNLIIKTMLVIARANNLKIIDHIGVSFLHASCVSPSCIPLTEEILQLGLDINAPVNKDSPLWPGYTPLHFAAHANVHTFILLLKNGADIAAADVEGMTPFDVCSQRFEVTELSKILKSDKTLAKIQFLKGPSLANAIDSFETPDSFVEFFTGQNLKESISYDSPVWPCFTIPHLAVKLSKTYYSFHHDYFVKKNHTSRNWYKYEEDADDFIKICFAQNLNMFAQDADHMTPLHIAFHLQKMRILNFILRNIKLGTGLFLNPQDWEGLSCLQIACIVNNSIVVEKMLKCNIKPNSPLPNDYQWYSPNTGLKSYRAGSTLYHIAAINNSEKMVKILLEARVECLNFDADGFTAVHTAFYNCCKKSMLSLLLTIPSYLDMNYKTPNSRLSHLHVACFADDVDSVKKLLTLPVNIEEPIEVKTVDLHADNLDPYVGYTALLLAVRSESHSVVRFLISIEVNIYAKTPENLNALCLGLIYCQNLYIVELLNEKFTSRNEWPTEFNLTKLHIACFLMNFDKVKALLVSGVDVNAQVSLDSPIWPGNTALHLAVDSLKFPLIQLLLDHNADCLIKNDENQTPLHKLWAIEVTSTFLYNDLYDTLSKTNSMISLMGHEFTKSNSTNNEGISHFHISCSLKNLRVAQKFIESGVNIDEQICPFSSICQGFTPLHMAIQFNRENIIKLLLDSGANHEIENSLSYTQLQSSILSHVHTFACLARRAKLDFKTQNVVGRSIFELISMQSNVSSYISILLQNDFSDFSISTVDKESFAKVTWELEPDIFRSFIGKATDILSVDENEKNIIHHVASYFVPYPTSVNLYADIRNYIRPCDSNVITLMIKGLDLDQRDNQGLTPLHVASKIGRLSVILFLSLGADVNAYDNFGLTSSMYSDKVAIKTAYSEHLYRMELAGFYINKSNEKFAKENRFLIEQFNKEQYAIELNAMREVKIVGDLTLRDVLTEEIVGRFPTMYKYKREAILDFLNPKEWESHYLQWEEWTRLLILQYNKLLKRLELIEPASKAYFYRVCNLPRLCIDSILMYLNNYDLENLIKV